MLVLAGCDRVLLVSALGFTRRTCWTSHSERPEGCGRAAVGGRDAPNIPHSRNISLPKSPQDWAHFWCRCYSARSIRKIHTQKEQLEQRAVSIEAGERGKQKVLFYKGTRFFSERDDLIFTTSGRRLAELPLRAVVTTRCAAAHTAKHWITNRLSEFRRAVPLNSFLAGPGFFAALLPPLSSLLAAAAAAGAAAPAGAALTAHRPGRLRLCAIVAHA